MQDQQQPLRRKNVFAFLFASSLSFIIFFQRRSISVIGKKYEVKIIIRKINLTDRFARNSICGNYSSNNLFIKINTLFICLCEIDFKKIGIFLQLTEEKYLLLLLPGIAIYTHCSRFFCPCCVGLHISLSVDRTQYTCRTKSLVESSSHEYIVRFVSYRKHVRCIWKVRC